MTTTDTSPATTHNDGLSQLIGFGARMPKRSVTNHEMMRYLQTNDRWITERTGIRERRISDETETAVFLASAAAREALEKSQLRPQDLDAIIVATSTPDSVFPATAVGVQRQLGVPPLIAFDVQAACAGFVYALSIADTMIKAKKIKTAMVIGVDIMSRLLNMRDRNTAILFGDGAGAVILKLSESQQPEGNAAGVLSSYISSNSQGWKSLRVNGGIGTPGNPLGFIEMNGKEVFRAAVTSMSSTVKKLLEQSGLGIDDIDWLVPHQANSRIIHAVGQALKLSSEKIYQTVQVHANTSAASLPLALHHGMEHQRIKCGQILVMVALGAGYVYGGAVVRL